MTSGGRAPGVPRLCTPALQRRGAPASRARSIPTSCARRAACRGTIGRPARGSSCGPPGCPDPVDDALALVELRPADEPVALPGMEYPGLPAHGADPTFVARTYTLDG